jgi:primosomal protein N''
MKTKFILLALISLLFGACNTTQLKIEKATEEIEYAERNKKGMTEQDFEKLQLQMEELEQDLTENRKNYSEEQIKEIGKIKGRYTALLIKKGIKDIQESVKDIGNQMEGFIEGFKTDTITNQ